jgi:hypothetical protein
VSPCIICGHGGKQSCCHTGRLGRALLQVPPAGGGAPANRAGISGAAGRAHQGSLLSINDLPRTLAPALA